MTNPSEQIDNILKIFVETDGEIKNPFILTGGSGAGKSFQIQKKAQKHKLEYVEINAATLTKEGHSGNSLSKALVPLSNLGGKLTICFIDEVDKLFIAGTSNSMLTHESSSGVQNEFLKLLESGEATVFGDYGKYNQINTEKVLYVFAGAFNNEENITIERLKAFGIKNEFIGRVPFIINLPVVPLEKLLELLNQSKRLEAYLKIRPEVSRKDVIETLKEYITRVHRDNCLGYRLVKVCIDRYFVQGKEAFNENVDTSDLIE